MCMDVFIDMWMDMFIGIAAPTLLQFSFHPIRFAISIAVVSSFQNRWPCTFRLTC